jgi:hypothetical protein
VNFHLEIAMDLDKHRQVRLSSDIEFIEPGDVAQVVSPAIAAMTSNAVAAFKEGMPVAFGEVESEGDKKLDLTGFGEKKD